MTNKDKMLRKVLLDQQLRNAYDYNLDDCEDLDSALHSSNAVVATVAMIVNELDEADPSAQKSLYTKVFNHLNNNLN